MLRKLFACVHPSFPRKAEPVQIPCEENSQNTSIDFELLHEAMFAISIYMYIH